MLNVCFSFSSGLGTLLQTDGHGGTQQVERSKENAADVQSSGNNRLRSELWNQFEITAFLEQNGGPSPSRARCKRCQTELMCETKKGTSVLRNHLNSKACSNKHRGATDPSSRYLDYFPALHLHTFASLF